MGTHISIGRGYWDLALSVVEQQNDKRHIVRRETIDINSKISYTNFVNFIICL